MIVQLNTSLIQGTPNYLQLPTVFADFAVECNSKLFKFYCRAFQKYSKDTAALKTDIPRHFCKVTNPAAELIFLVLIGCTPRSREQEDCRR